MNALVALVALTYALQAPPAKPKAPAAPAPDRVVLRSPQAGALVVLGASTDVLRKLEEVVATKDREKVEKYLDEAQSAGVWRRLESFTPAIYQGEETFKGKQSTAVFFRVEVTDGPNKGVVGLVQREFTVRPGQGDVDREEDRPSSGRPPARRHARPRMRSLVPGERPLKSRTRNELTSLLGQDGNSFGTLRHGRMPSMMIQAANAESLRMSAGGDGTGPPRRTCTASGGPIIFIPTPPRPY